MVGLGWEEGWEGDGGAGGLVERGGERMAWGDGCPGRGLLR